MSVFVQFFAQNNNILWIQLMFEYEVLNFRKFERSNVQKFERPKVRRFRNSEVRNFESSNVSKSWKPISAE